MPTLSGVETHLERLDHREREVFADGRPPDLLQSECAQLTQRKGAQRRASQKWKSPREYWSIVFNQSGFDVDSNTDCTDYARLPLSKLGSMDLEYHRDLPEDRTIKQVILEEEKSRTWHASIVVDRDPDYLAKPPIEILTPEDTVGIDLGIRSFTHDSDGTAVTPLDEDRDRDWIEKRHHALARKQYESHNWEKARENLAAAYERLAAKRKDLREKLAHSTLTSTTPCSSKTSAFAGCSNKTAMDGI